MKILLVALNSKYIHSNIALYTLKAYAQKRLENDNVTIEIAEYTINQPLAKIRSDIMKKHADIICMSCYIWNRTEIFSLVSDIGKIAPESEIWLGGPEVSFDAECVLNDLPSLRGVMRGEGEETLKQIICHYADSDAHPLCTINDITYRDESGIVVTVASPRMNLDQIDFPYESLDGFENRIVYYESSRGCPFRCSYCLSSVDKKLSLRSLEKVQSELAFFLKENVPQVKFIDRSFNCNKEHAMAIWRYIKENDNGVSNFHFEIAADILDEEEIELLKSMRPGLVQLEIGIQSTNEKTIREINRPMDFDKVRHAVSKLRQNGNINIHLDLIAGLPYEDMGSFRKSFNDVIALRPHQFQLGFLKVLRGSPMEKRSGEYELMYTQMPPYEVLRTRWISYEDITKLKAVEEMVEVYYSSGQFTKSMDALLAASEDKFALFEKLAAYYQEHGYEMVNLSRNSRYEILLDFAKAAGFEDIAVHWQEHKFDNIRESLIYDYYARDNVRNRPQFFGEETVDKESQKAFYRRESEQNRYLKGTEYDGADSRKMRHLAHLENLGGSLYLFDYSRRDPVTGNCHIIKLNRD